MSSLSSLSCHRSLEIIVYLLFYLFNIFVAGKQNMGLRHDEGLNCWLGTFHWLEIILRINGTKYRFYVAPYETGAEKEKMSNIK